MQWDFNVVKVNYEDWICELEVFIQKLLCFFIFVCDGFSFGQVLEGLVNMENFFLGVKIVEGGLFFFFYNYFINLRNEIEVKVNKVMDMEIRLNDMIVVLQQVYDEFFKNSQKVIVVEN